MKMKLLTDEEHMATVARLGGIDTTFFKEFDREKIERCYDDSIQDEQVAVLILSKSIKNALSEKVRHHMALGKPPFILCSPNYGSGLRSMKEDVEW